MPETKINHEATHKTGLKPLSFGIELEFCLGYVPHGRPNPDPSDKRRVDFKDPSYFPEDQRAPDGYAIDLIDVIQQDIIQTLVDKGYAAKLDNHDQQSDDVPPREWWVMSDSSIKLPQDEPEGYEFVKIEIASPAWFVSDRSAKQVEAVLGLLKETYYVVTNESTGLHVHVGRGKDGFSFKHMRDLIAMLWAYELQLSSIHPPSRFFDDGYHQSMRKKSNYALDVARLGQKAIDGMNYFLGVKDMQTLLYMASCGKRNGDYNFKNLIPRKSDGGPIRKTIEFRGHEATLDTGRVRNWILTVGGIVDWVRTASDFDKETLRLLAKTEEWEKLGNSEDEGKEEELGPVMADKDFTIVHLLEFMKLYEPASFYLLKGPYKHRARRDDDPSYLLLADRRP